MAFQKFRVKLSSGLILKTSVAALTEMLCCCMLILCRQLVCDTSPVQGCLSCWFMVFSLCAILRPGCSLHSPSPSEHMSGSGALPQFPSLGSSLAACSLIPLFYGLTWDHGNGKLVTQGNLVFLALPSLLLWLVSTCHHVISAEVKHPNRSFSEHCSCGDLQFR